MLRLGFLLFGQVVARRSARLQGRGKRPVSGRWSWLADPRSTVLMVLASALLIGGGRKWLLALRARRALDRIDESNVTPEEIASLAAHGRSVAMELFRILGTSPDPAFRQAAGKGLATLWARDQLVPEEEKAIVARGFVATWRARRRYPRGMYRAIPISVEYGVPFLTDSAGQEAVRARNLEWSHRILGTERVSLETFSEWTSGPGVARVALEPSDFPTNGPHRLIFQSRVRTTGLTSPWEMDLPHIPFTFEFDSILSVDALLTAPDDQRGAVIARAVRLVPSDTDVETPTYLDLNAEWAVRNPPRLVVAPPLPCDLAHRLTLEIEGFTEPIAAGEVTLTGQGGDAGSGRTVTLEMRVGEGIGENRIERPGTYRIRAVLSPDSARGWADPDVRSVWPGTIVTDWCDARIVRK